MEQPKIEQPKKEEAEKELFKHVKTVLDGALAKEGKYAHNQAKVYTISIEAFTKTHADELARLKRLNEIAEIYKSEFEKQKKAHPEKKDDRYWHGKAQDFIFSSVLTEQEKQELKHSVKNEESRQKAGWKDQGGVHPLFAPTAEYSLSSLLNEINKAKTEQPKIKQPEKEAEKKKEKPKKKSQPKAGPPQAEKEPEKEKKPEPEKEKKPLTLDEKIALKEEELENVERKYNIYYRPVGWFHKKPVIRDLEYYALEARLRDLKKEVKELKNVREKTGGEIILEKAPKEMPEEKKPITTEGQLEAVEKNLRSVYGKIRYRKRKIREGGVLGRADLEKNIALLEKERDRLKETKGKIKERLAIEKRLKEIPEEIKKSGVLGRLALEKEEKRLEKRLRKLKK